jgi:hypothetical protein
MCKRGSWWGVGDGEVKGGEEEKGGVGGKEYGEKRAEVVAVQNGVKQWYQTRQMNGNLQRRTMREIKVTHGERLQEQYYPEKPLDTDEFHDHIIARYIKTAQDEIVEALDLSY